MPRLSICQETMWKGASRGDFFSVRTLNIHSMLNEEIVLNEENASPPHDTSFNFCQELFLRLKNTAVLGEEHPYNPAGHVH